MNERGNRKKRRCALAAGADRGAALKRWEAALLLSLCVTLCHGAVFTAPGVAWWGVIFPGLSEPVCRENVETVKLDGGRDGGVEVRFRFLEWLEEIF